MKHRIFCLVFVSACQTTASEPTATVTSGLEPSDCYGEASYCGATLPKPGAFTGALPWSPPTTVIVLSAQGQGFWIAYGADPTYGKVHWAVRTTTPAGTGALMNAIAGSNQPYGGLRPPPPPLCPPLCGDGGPMILESALRIENVQKQSEDAAAACQ